VQVTQLWRYPVKSAAGERLDTARVGELGIDGDRQWGVVDLDSGLVLTARRCPELLFAEPAPTAGGMALRLADGRVTADDRELSDWLGRRVELRRPDPDERAEYEIAEDDLDPDSDWIRWQGPKGVFHDSKRTRLSIVSEEAMGDWDVRRFRPNVVVRGGDERDLVDSDVRLGEVHLRVTKQIDRCVIVNRPQPGLERDRSILSRINAERATFLGVGALVRRPGTIRLGDHIAPLP
jgi:uncharacterized protein YcbX